MTSNSNFPLTRFAQRRRFLQLSTAALSGLALANCRRALEGPSGAVSAGDPKQLNLYTWADYVSEDLYQRFTQKTGIAITHDVYDSNEVMLAKLQAGGGAQYSIIYPSDYMVRQMVELKMLASIDPARVTGLDSLRDRWKNPPYDPENAHSIPFNWGTTGLLYNTRAWKQPPQDWSDLWTQKPVSGRLTLLDDVREVMGATLRSLGYSYNSTSEKEIEAAFNRLQELKPAIAAFQTFGWEDQLTSGDLALSMTFSLLGNKLPLEQPQLKFVLPQSGTSLWTDTMAIPVNAPNPEAAYAWINFMLEPENAVQAVTELRVATPSQTAFDQLPAELKNNATLFPPQSFIDKCEGIVPVGEAIQIYDRFWTQLKSV